MPQVVDLGYHPRPWQLAVHRGRKRFGVLIAHRRAGKTVLAVMALIDEAIVCPRERGQYAYVAPYMTQAKRIAWPYLKAFALKIPGTKIQEQTSTVTLANGAIIQIYGADDPQSLRGIYLDGLVLDEVAQMRPETWEEVLRPALSDRDGWALFIGTPNGVNLLSDLYHRAQRDSAWYHGLYTVYDTDALPEREVIEIKAALSPQVFAREFLCDFNVPAANQFFNGDAVRAAMKRLGYSTQYDPVVMGVDVARFGDDESVITIRKGRDCKTVPQQRFRNVDAMMLVGHITHWIEQCGNAVEAIFVDATGVGGPVADRLRQLGYKVVDVNNGAKSDCPSAERCANKGTECWARAREWIMSGGAIPDDPELCAQLTARLYTFNAHNEIMLESKKDLAARGLNSPDRADSFCLTFSYPVQSRLDREHRSVHGGVTESEYDPYQNA